MKSYLIMMAVRLLEMRRLLKPTGSLYLHCDPTASPLPKDAFRWRVRSRQLPKRDYMEAHHSTGRGSKRFANNGDNLLYYVRGGERFSWNQQYKPHDPAYVKRFYRHVEAETGRIYRLGDLKGAGNS